MPITKEFKIIDEQISILPGRGLKSIFALNKHQQKSCKKKEAAAPDGIPGNISDQDISQNGPQDEE